MQVYNFASHGDAIITNYSTNTNITSLRSSPEWQMLLNRVGPSPLVTLFANPTNALYTSLPNDCYLQISGKPFCDLKRKLVSTDSGHQSRKRKNKDPITSTISLLAVGTQDPVKKKRRQKVRKRPRNKLEATQEDEGENEEDQSLILNDSPSPPKRSRMRVSFSAPQLVPRADVNAARIPLRPTQSVAGMLNLGKRKAVDVVAEVVKKKVRVDEV